MDFYRCQKEDVLKQLQTHKEGLSPAEAESRLQKDGYNVLEEGKKVNPVVLFFSQFQDFMTILLMIAAGISAVLSFITKDRNDLIDTVILLVIILLNNVIGFIQQYRADTAIQKMKNMSVCLVKVRRGGRDMLIDSRRLVVGDIVCFEEGDRVPADCRILSAKNLKCNESALTGESAEVEKEDAIVDKALPLGDRKNMLYSSTYVVRGGAEGVVVQTGMRTEIGKIAKLITHAELLKTPLERALEKLGKIISFAVVGIALFLFLFGSIFKNQGLLPNFMSSVAVAVAAIPEGLPAVVTVLMAMGVQKMSRHRAIVRKLQAVETLGGCDCICSDKTGTLTQNKMTVQEIYTLTPADGQRLFECMEYCNTVKGEQGQFIGDATEIALKNYLADNCINIPRTIQIDQIPFDSDRKMMSVFMQTNQQTLIYTKGGAEVVLKKCSRILDGGVVRPLEKSDCNKIHKVCTEMAKKALRVLGFAYRPADGEKIEDNLIFIGVCGMIDPPKAGAWQAVQSCKEAGIGVVMITGDQKDTALAIAKRLNIAQSPTELVTGEELDALEGKALEERIASAKVFARVNSGHKTLIVKALQKKGKTVAMTGDGVNDAPAVRNADIGIAMGSGTDVTKSVADIVVTDDDFSTIVTAVGEGRRIFANIRKTISFFLATNFAEVLSVLFISLFLYQFDFLNSTQLLWINLITDTLPVLALGAEKAEKNVMRRPPQRAEKEMFSLRSLLPVLLFGVLQSACAVGTFIFALNMYGNAVALTMTFFTMSFSELFYAFNVRTENTIFSKAFFENKLLFVTVIFALVINALLCVIPPLSQAFGIVALNGLQWGMVLSVCVFAVLMGEGYKLLLRCYEKERKKMAQKQKTERMTGRVSAHTVK